MSERPAVCEIALIKSVLQENAYIVHIPAAATSGCHHFAGTRLSMLQLADTGGGSLHHKCNKDSL